MPVYQVYFAAPLAADIETLARKQGIKANEFIQKTVGSHISKNKSQKTKKEFDPVTENDDNA